MTDIVRRYFVLESFDIEFLMLAVVLAKPARRMTTAKHQSPQLNPCNANLGQAKNSVRSHRPPMADSRLRTVPGLFKRTSHNIFIR